MKGRSSKWGCPILELGLLTCFPLPSCCISYCTSESPWDSPLPLISKSATSACFSASSLFFCRSFCFCSFWSNVCSRYCDRSNRSRFPSAFFSRQTKHASWVLLAGQLASKRASQLCNAMGEGRERAFVIQVFIIRPSPIKGFPSRIKAAILTRICKQFYLIWI